MKVSLLFKRLLDLFAATAALIVLSPILFVVAVLVRIKLGRPILFRQKRPGLHGSCFELLKLRTMTDERDEKGELLCDEKRLTRFGKFLRSTSLDELPSLLNVIRGHMSLVGPRPLRVEYLKLYNTEQARRHHMKPGITGWAQINGRNAISWEEKFRFDVWYVDNFTLWLDTKIIFLTVKKVFVREGIAAENEATMGWFTGSETKQENK